MNLSVTVELERLIQEFAQNVVIKAAKANLKKDARKYMIFSRSHCAKEKEENICQ